MENKKLIKIIYAALLTALVILGTMVIKIPIPIVSGYINLGDFFIFLGSFLFGPVIGGVAGGLGAGLADVLSGYGQWAPFTFIIKALMGIIIGKIAFKEKFYSIKNLIGIIIAVIILVGGYYLAGSILIGSFVTGLSSIPYDFLQGLISSILYFLIGGKVSKINFDNIN